MNTNDIDLIADIQYTSDICHIELPVENIMRELEKITSLEDAALYAKNSLNLLWRWLPAIVFSRFGKDAYLNDKWALEDRKHSYAMIHPVFQTQCTCIHDSILNHNFDIVEKIYLRFSPELAAYCYGGFPWFRSYCKLCMSVNSFGKKATIYKIRAKKSDNQDVIKDLCNFKNFIRGSFGGEISRDFSGEKYPGVIRAFHTPVHIEIAPLEFFLNKESHYEN